MIGMFLGDSSEFIPSSKEISINKIASKRCCIGCNQVFRSDSHTHQINCLTHCQTTEIRYPREIEPKQ